jgi:hypothetical protein
MPPNIACHGPLPDGLLVDDRETTAPFAAQQHRPYRPERSGCVWRDKGGTSAAWPSHRPSYVNGPMSSWLTPKRSARRLRRRGCGQPSAGRSLKLLAPLPALTGLPPRQRHVGMPIGSNAAPRRPEPHQTREWLRRQIRQVPSAADPGTRNLHRLLNVFPQDMSKPEPISISRDTTN